MSSAAPILFAEPQNFQQQYYRQNGGKTAGCIILSIVTIGIFPLICLLKRDLWIRLSHDRCDAKLCTVVIFEEYVTKRRHVFNVLFFTNDESKHFDTLKVQPCSGSLGTSNFVKMRINVGSGWTLQYDDSANNRCFVPFVKERTSVGEDYTSSHSPYRRDPAIAEQLEIGVNWLNEGQDDMQELLGFKQSLWKTIFLYIAWGLSAGILWLFCYWQPYLELQLTHKRCHLLSADTVLIMTPPRKNKKDDRHAADILDPCFEVLFSSGLLVIIYAIVPLGLLFGLGMLIFLYIKMRPYFVRQLRHSTRDGLPVNIVESSNRSNDYFMASACSETSIVKFFTWQKVKYVWSGVAHDSESDTTMPLYRFERQSGLIASDDIRDSSPALRLYFKHQILGIAPTLSYIHSCIGGLTDEQVTQVRGMLGGNKMKIKLTPLFIVFLKEILTPFYLFQIASVTIWLIDEYFVYAYVIIILTTLSAIWQIIIIRLDEVALRKTMTKPAPVEIIRPGAEEFKLQVDPSTLVPGDVVLIPQGGCVLQCDVALLNGTCLVDEAMLTGESVPVLKFGLPPIKKGENDNELIQIRTHERSLLFCGTRVLQANPGPQADGRIRAVVIRTGFTTAKGELTRLILYPKPFDFEFASDAAKFVGVMGVMAVTGLCYSIGLRVNRGEETMVIVKRSLDIVTIAVPPALPIALTIGYMMAKSRLQKKNVFCTSPSSINLAGVIDVVCMDKTGTMTEGGLDFEKLLPAADGHFISQAQPGSMRDGQLLRCLVSCHSLALVDGKAIGDPMEEKMFEMAGWSLQDGSAFQQPAIWDSKLQPQSICHPPQLRAGTKLAPSMAIVRQLPFSSHFQRMSVVACPIDDAPIQGMSLYMKGAPEVVVGLCRITTVPADLDLHLGALTECGYRVLGLATKNLSRLGVDDMLSADRAQLERDLDFLGLLVFENKLKPETCPTIEKLKKAKMRLIMLTGDNPLTAVSVARQAGIIEDADQVLIVNAVEPSTETNSEAKLEYVEIKQAFPPSNDFGKPTKKQKKLTRPPSNIINMLPPNPPQPMKLVCTGASLSVIKQHFPDEMEKILMRGAVFARVKPDHKKDVIEGLQKLGFYALMCGDGANDCGALRAACTGISLSQAEASVASPFTSAIENISCIHLLIREGRCALVTSFGIFRFMLLYALIQFISCFILYYNRTNLTQFGFLYADLFITTTLVFTMGFTHAYEHLVADRPPSSLLGVKMIASLIIQAILIIGFQVLAYLYCIHGNHWWYLPFKPPPDDSETYMSFEYYSVFIVSTFQYPMISFVLSKGIPFRKPVYTNWLYMINVLVNIASNIFICFDPTLPFPPEPKNLVNIDYGNFGELLEFEMPPTMEYRGILFLFACIYCASSLLAELIFVERDWLSIALTACGRKLSRKSKGSQRRYEILEEQLGSGAERWPRNVRQSAQGAASIFSTDNPKPLRSFSPMGNTSSTQFLLPPSSSSLDIISDSQDSLQNAGAYSNPAFNHRNESNDPLYENPEDEYR